MRGVSLEEISLATRIAPRFLAALEAEQWEKLPGGVFNRGFIRSVAHYLGLDEDSMVAEYALHTKGRPEPGVVADPPDRPETQWRQIAVLTVFILIVVAVCWFAIRFLVPRVTAYLHKRAAASSNLTPDHAVPSQTGLTQFAAYDFSLTSSPEVSAFLLDLQGPTVALPAQPPQASSVALTPKDLKTAVGAYR